MADETPPGHGLALGYFYRKRGLTPAQAADRLGLADAGTLRKLEKGILKMSRETLDEKAGRLGFTPEDVDAFLFGDGLVEPEPPPQPASPVALTREELRRIDRAVVAAAWAAGETVRAELIRRKKARKAAAAHREAEELWARLKPLPRADRRDLVRVFPHYRSWALVVRICRESERRAAHDAAEAVEPPNSPSSSRSAARARNAGAPAFRRKPGVSSGTRVGSPTTSKEPMRRSLG